MLFRSICLIWRSTALKPIKTISGMKTVFNTDMNNKFSKRKSYNLFHKINWGINTIDFPTYITKVPSKNITRNHLSKMKNTCSNLRFLPATPRQHTWFPSSSFFFLLSSLSSFFFFLPFWLLFFPSRPLPLGGLYWPILNYLNTTKSLL